MAKVRPRPSVAFGAPATAAVSKGLMTALLGERVAAAKIGWRIRLERAAVTRI
jgi:hypothetical protein